MKKTLLATLVIAVTSMSAAAFDLDGADRYKSAAELGIMEGLVVDADKQVNKDNAFQVAPYNRWAYQNMRMFYPTSDIAPAEEAINLERAIDASVKNVMVDNGKGEMRTFDQFMTETWGDGIVVIKGEKVVYEDYRNGMTKDTPHQLMSVTKSFGGLMALMAIDAGKVDADAQITKYVPELKGATGFDGATVQQVLDMTNSMDFSEVYDDPTSGIRTYGAVLNFTEKLEGIDYPSSMYEYLQTLGKDTKHDHGEIFHYQTPKTDVVNWITNNVNGSTFQEGLESLWNNIGASGETYVLLDGNGTPVAGGGLNATPDNLAKFATMMLNDGEFNGEQVVPKAVVDTLAAGGDRDAFGNGPDASDNMPAGEWSYRGQWWVKHTEGAEAFMAIGIHGQWIYIDRDRDVAIVKVSSAPDSVTPAQELYDLNGLDAIVKHVSK
ncbi:serine hydrolase domain-containing protein [Vibrio agarivorans]|uniref:Serine hydrolase n=1 Tax=Vibrio agarivorans TaxID=153622 RepID=A0ABT7Y608_9VIBR|nr:serine hydrolase [Vibrio agarivorans]MDN2483380.1 serine hydrolase [Vibrio agarivorans]